MNLNEITQGVIMHVVVIQSCTPYNDTGGHTASSSLSNMSSVKVTTKIFLY